MVLPRTLRAVATGLMARLLLSMVVAVLLVLAPVQRSAAQGADPLQAGWSAPVICHLPPSGAGTGQHPDKTPGHDCQLCPACHLAAHAALAVRETTVAPRAAVLMLATVALPPPATGPPAAIRLATPPTGPPAASL